MTSLSEFYWAWFGQNARIEADLVLQSPTQFHQKAQKDNGKYQAQGAELKHAIVSLWHTL